MELTKREREILPLLCLSLKAIQKRLNLSEGTVKNHILNMSYKFPKFENRFCILIYALQEGIITLDEIVIEEEYEI